VGAGELPQCAWCSCWQLGVEILRALSMSRKPNEGVSPSDAVAYSG